jgi:hypothetical protein
MEVNNIFTQIGDFWDRISMPIVFHIIFLFTFIFLFGNFSLKTILENYISSKSFKRTKVILEEFELWKKLPLILLFSLLIYLTFFNSVLSQICSIQLFPFELNFSKETFLGEYTEKENIIEIAKYGNDINPDFFKINQLIAKFSEEYKSKYPEKFNEWVKYFDDDFESKIRTLNLALLTFIILTFFYLKFLFTKKKKSKILMTVKFLIVVVITFPIVFILRYQAEQNIEEKFANEIMFVKTSLEVDDNRSIKLSEHQIQNLKVNLKNTITNDPKPTYDSFWVSEIVGKTKILEAILGERKLGNINAQNNNLAY